MVITFFINWVILQFKSQPDSEHAVIMELFLQNSPHPLTDIQMAKYFHAIFETCFYHQNYYVS